MTPLKILLADDHEVIRRGLKQIIEAQRGWQVVGEAVTGREAVEKTQKLKPEIVLLDIAMPELNGLEAARQILKMAPKTEILILTMYESEQLVRDLLETGAHGYLFKSDAARDLVTAVESLREHRPYFTTAVAKMVLEGYLKSRATRNDESSSALTSRERQIVQLLAEGKTSKEVAVVLGITVKTAETHRANLMRKLDLHSVSDLVHYAVRNNIVEP